MRMTWLATTAPGVTSERNQSRDHAKIGSERAAIASWSPGRPVSWEVIWPNG